MSTFPATTFTNALQTGFGSPLYMVHTDVTKTLESPHSINELINGNETEAQYSNIVSVPEGARGFVPFVVVNATFSSANDYPSELKINVVATSANPLRFFFLGQIPQAAAALTYGPVQAGMANAVSTDTFGYWHALGAWRLAAATGGGADNFVGYLDANNTGALPSAFTLPTVNAAGTSRTYVISTLYGRALTGPIFEYLCGAVTSPITTGPYSGPTPESGMVPLYGVSKITCIGTHGSAAPTVTVGMNMGSGTLVSINAGIGIRFVF